MLFKAGLFYADFISDILYAKLLWDKGLGGIAYIVITILAAPPVIVSAVDLGVGHSPDLEDAALINFAEIFALECEPEEKDRLFAEARAAEKQRKGFMVLLNFTNTRMLYILLLPLIGDTPASVAYTSGSSLKLFEAVFEAM